MKLPAFLSKPRWLSKDAEVRRSAAQLDRDPDLMAALPRLAREDPDAGVRIAALRRLADPALAQGLAQDDADDAVRAQARRLWLELMAGTHPSAPPLVERVRLLAAQDDDELLEHVVRKSPEAELRGAALARVTRPALLFERALEETDSGLRLALVERIDDEGQLARLAERARRTDKNLNRAARERIDALRLARGDADAVAAQARALCEQLEQLVRDAGSPVDEAPIVERWALVAAAADPALVQRFETARQLLATSREPAPPPAPAASAEDTPPAAESDPAVDSTTGTDEIGSGAGHAEGVDAPEPRASAEEIVAQQIAAAQFAAALDEARAAKQQHAQRQRELIGELEQAVADCAAALDAGSSGDAHAAHARIEALRRQIDAVPAALARRLGKTEARHAELRQWQRWSDNQRRRQLCEEVEALVDSGLHPDAIATRVREAQAEWNRLGALEGRSDARPDGLARRFHGACRAAFAPTETYFRKRQELRESEAERLHALLARTDALPADANRATLGGVRRELVEALRGLDGIDPRQRKAMAARLKQALDALDQRIRQLDAEVEAARAVLIGEAEALTRDGLQRGAVATARELQQRWQELGHGRRARDEAQWKTFRAALDAVFGALDAARTERKARDAQAQAQAEEVCQRIEALTADEDAERGMLAKLGSEWEALRVRDEALQRRFDAARSTLEQRLVRRERERRHARFGAWLARYELCRRAEAGADDAVTLREQWEAAPPCGIAAQSLSQRFDAALAGPVAPGPENAEAFAELLLELEFLAGVESPQDALEQRRALQVARLAARMRGEAAGSEADELANLLQRWSELGTVPAAELDERLRRAVLGAIDTLS